MRSHEREQRMKRQSAPFIDTDQARQAYAELEGLSPAQALREVKMLEDIDHEISLDQERELFIKFNFLKFKAVQLHGQAEGRAFQEAADEFRRQLASYGSRVRADKIARVLARRDDGFREDLQQQVYIKLHQSGVDLCDPFSNTLRSYVAVMASRLAIDMKRRRTKDRLDFMFSDLDENNPALHSLDSGGQASSDEAALQERRNIIARQLPLLLDELGASTGEVPEITLTLQVWLLQDLTYEDIAEILETELGTVKSRMNKARKRLREALEKNPKKFWELLQVLEDMGLQ